LIKETHRKRQRSR